MENSGKSALGLDANVAAGLAYIPVCGINLIMSIIILVTDKTEDYNTRKLYAKGSLNANRDSKGRLSIICPMHSSLDFIVATW